MSSGKNIFSFKTCEKGEGGVKRKKIEGRKGKGKKGGGLPFTLSRA